MLAPFFSRIADAAVPLLDDVDAEQLAAHLTSTHLHLTAGPDAQPSGVLMAANLAARLYPTVTVDTTDPALTARAIEAMRKINPDITTSFEAPATVRLILGDPTATPEAGTAIVDSVGWTAYLDQPAAQRWPTAPVAAMAAACIGMGEVFRYVFAAALGDRGRGGPTPAVVNLVELTDAQDNLPIPEIDIEHAALVGGGAVGQAALLALSGSQVTGIVTIIDPEQVELSNLQRYVLTTAGDVGAVKVNLAQDRAQTATLTIKKAQQAWTAGLLEELGAQRTLCALDTAQQRILLAAALPGPIYNAWTQPRDLGFSRHEHFGQEPCLACLYWPIEAKPNQHELIAEAVGEHPLRVLAYLTINAPVGTPIPVQAIPQLAALPAPGDAPGWTGRPILDDIAARHEIAAERLDRWRGAPLDVLYREVVCGEAMLDFSFTGIPQETRVPLAHQSALAGVMLAVELLCAADHVLARARPAATEGRLHVLAALPQVLARPRQRTVGCICSDRDFVEAANAPHPGVV